VKPLRREETLANGQAKWQTLLAGQRLLHVQRLARVLVPHVAQLVTDAEAHPGFIKVMPNGEQLLLELLEQNPLIAPDSQASSLPNPSIHWCSDAFSFLHGHCSWESSSGAT
jgi:hypothetical protein